jgi:hypothetical protein
MWTACSSQQTCWDSARRRGTGRPQMPKITDPVSGRPPAVNHLWESRRSKGGGWEMIASAVLLIACSCLFALSVALLRESR